MRFFLISLSLLLLCGCRSTLPEHHVARRPQPREKQIFLVIDDAGLTLQETQQYLDIPVPMTISVMPYRKHSSDVCAAIARDPNKEIILHQPMEAYSREANPGAGAIYNNMKPSEIPAILDRNLKSVRGAVGMNNHEGSKVTENPVLMRAVLRYCKAHGLFFLDSKTAYNSVVPRVALQEHMHVEQRDCFLDIQHNRAYIRRMWAQAVAKASKNGYAIIIGHAWSAETAAAIRDSYQTLLNQGYTFHKLSELYR